LSYLGVVPAVYRLSNIWRKALFRTGPHWTRRRDAVLACASAKDTLSRSAQAV
jgi:hypothetical protein